MVALLCSPPTLPILQLWGPGRVDGIETERDLCNVLVIMDGGISLFSRLYHIRKSYMNGEAWWHGMGGKEYISELKKLYINILL